MEPTVTCTIPISALMQSPHSRTGTGSQARNCCLSNLFTCTLNLFKKCQGAHRPLHDFD